MHQQPALKGASVLSITPPELVLDPTDWLCDELQLTFGLNMSYPKYKVLANHKR